MSFRDENNQKYMKQTRFFKPEQYEELNNFLKTVSPRGANGLLCNTSGYFVFYEIGEPMGALEQITSLRFNIGEQKEKIMHTRKEIIMTENRMKLAEKDIATITSDKESGKFTKKSEYEMERVLKAKQDEIDACKLEIGAKKKMITIEQSSIDAMRVLIKEIEKEEDAAE